MKHLDFAIETIRSARANYSVDDERQTYDFLVRALSFSLNISRDAAEKLFAKAMVVMA